MPTLLEQFRDATARWWTAPSGWEYEICALAHMPGEVGLDAVFELHRQREAALKAMEAAAEATPESADKPSDSTPTEEDRTRVKPWLYAIARGGVRAVRWNGIEQRPAPAAEQFPGGDIPLLVQEIQKAAEPSPEVVSEALEVL